MSNYSVSILVTSCDLYRDCWEPLIFSFKKFWPDCPYPLYIISNYEGESTENVTFIKVGEHLGWGINTKKALRSIKTKYILHFHEDYFLCRKVSTEQFEEHVNYMEKHNLDYLRLSNNPDRDK